MACVLKKGYKMEFIKLIIKQKPEFEGAEDA
jgi:hypothetical protein